MQRTNLYGNKVDLQLPVLAEWQTPACDDLAKAALLNTDDPSGVEVQRKIQIQAQVQFQKRMLLRMGKTERKDRKGQSSMLNTGDPAGVELRRQKSLNTGTDLFKSGRNSLAACYSRIPVRLPK